MKLNCTGSRTSLIVYYSVFVADNIIYGGPQRQYTNINFITAIYYWLRHQDDYLYAQPQAIWFVSNIRQYTGVYKTHKVLICRIRPGARWSLGPLHDAVAFVAYALSSFLHLQGPLFLAPPKIFLANSQFMVNH